MVNYKGKVIDGRYEVTTLIKSDIVSSVYRCFDNKLNQNCRIRLFNAEAIKEDGAYTRIIKYARSIINLKGEGISTIRDVVLGDLLQYVISDDENGYYIKSYLNHQNNISWYSSSRIMLRLLSAMEIIHAKGVCLGNLDINKLIITSQHNIKLIDFIDINYLDLKPSALKLLDKDIAYYVPPELSRENAITIYSDVYSLGVLFYKLVTGKYPYSGNDFLSIICNKSNRYTIPREINSDIPIGVEQIIIKAINDNPVYRFKDIEEFIGAIKQVIENPDYTFTSRARSERKEHHIRDKSNQTANISKNSRNLIRLQKFKEHTKMNYRFKCPYCFGEMSHEEVLFRGVTTFREEEFDPTGQGRGKTEIELISDDNERNKLLKEYERRAFFSQKKDEVYHNWYKVNKFGTTSENPGSDEIPVYDRPIIKPHDHGTSGLIYDEDGFAIELRDPWDEPTRERVCVHCHNPLPLGYGKFPVRYISVIGISGAGKTVYLSKLIQFISEYTARLKIATTPSPSSVEFVRKNPVKEGAPLPAPTVRMQLEQPLSYNIKYRNGENETFVIYDIAGENCEKAADLLKYGKFVTHSNGIILLIDPVKELGIGGGAVDNKLDLVLDNINSLFGVKGLNDIPLAVCISKSDLMRDTLRSAKFFDKVEPIRSKFNSEDYNEISRELNDFINSNAVATKVKLNENYSRYNFFAFTTLGCATKVTYLSDEFGNEYEAEIPKNPPNPKRIEEPLFWLFKQFGYVSATGPIFTPKNEEALEESAEIVSQIKELQNRLNAYPRICIGKKAREKESLNNQIAALQKRKLELDQEIRKFAQ